MKYRKHSELQNTYPSTPEDISKKYSEENSQIKYSGKFPDNFINFEIISVTDINPGNINISEGTSFRFIVRFDGNDDDGGEYWTSPSFLDDLRDSLEKDQPYFNRETVSLLVVDYQHLKNYWLNPKFVGEVGIKGELYAEVRITETIDTKQEMLKHIDWMVTPEQPDDTLRIVETFGSWELYTSPQLGFTPEQFTPGTGSIQPTGEDDVVSTRSVDRNAGSGDIRDSDSDITGSSVPIDRQVDRNTGSGDIRDSVGETTSTTGRTGSTRGR